MSEIEMGNYLSDGLLPKYKEKLMDREDLGIPLETFSSIRKAVLLMESNSQNLRNLTSGNDGNANKNDDLSNLYTQIQELKALVTDRLTNEPNPTAYPFAQVNLIRAAKKLKPCPKCGISGHLSRYCHKGRRTSQMTHSVNMLHAIEDDDKHLFSEGGVKPNIAQKKLNTENGHRRTRPFVHQVLLMDHKLMNTNRLEQAHSSSVQSLKPKAQASKEYEVFPNSTSKVSNLEVNSEIPQSPGLLKDIETQEYVMLSEDKEMCLDRKLKEKPVLKIEEFPNSEFPKLKIDTKVNSKVEMPVNQKLEKVEKDSVLTVEPKPAIAIVAKELRKEIASPKLVHQIVTRPRKLNKFLLERDNDTKLTSKEEIPIENAPTKNQKNPKTLWKMDPESRSEEPQEIPLNKSLDWKKKKINTCTEDDLHSDRNTLNTKSNLKPTLLPEEMRHIKNISTFPKIPKISPGKNQVRRTNKIDTLLPDTPHIPTHATAKKKSKRTTEMTKNDGQNFHSKNFFSFGGE
jgi:hypothetical protein